MRVVGTHSEILVVNFRGEKSGKCVHGSPIMGELFHRLAIKTLQFEFHGSPEKTGQFCLVFLIFVVTVNVNLQVMYLFTNFYLQFNALF